MMNAGYTLYQIADIESTQYAFRSYKFAQSHGFNFGNDYKEVYFGEVSGDSVRDMLETLWEIFNINHPYDFRGHSLSVSDIVRIEIDGQERFFYCDDFGWTELTAEVQEVA